MFLARKGRTWWKTSGPRYWLFRRSLMATERLPVICDEAKEVYVGTRTNISSLYTGFHITAPCCCRKKATALSSMLCGFHPIVSAGLCQHGPLCLCLEFCKPFVDRRGTRREIAWPGERAAFERFDESRIPTQRQSGQVIHPSFQLFQVTNTGTQRRGSIVL